MWSHDLVGLGQGFVSLISGELWEVDEGGDGRKGVRFIYVLGVPGAQALRQLQGRGEEHRKWSLRGEGGFLLSAETSG